MKADLHTHSTASDGTLSPAQLVALALSRGVEVLAITDHDSVDGYPEACSAAQGQPITLIPAVELSAVRGGSDVHVLAYFVNPEDSELSAYLSLLRAARTRRAEIMVAALADAGFDLTLDDVLALSDGGAVGRSHVARALVATGAAQSPADAFSRLIGRNRPFYVAKESATPEEVVSRIRAFGAVPVIAHPGVSRADAIIPSLVAAGLLGIEAYHADHSARQKSHYATMASELGLLVTGGTDYHGPEAPNADLGSIALPDGAAEELLRAGGVI